MHNNRDAENYIGQQSEHDRKLYNLTIAKRGQTSKPIRANHQVPMPNPYANP
jgi:hypothetical protein